MASLDSAMILFTEFTALPVAMLEAKDGLIDLCSSTPGLTYPQSAAQLPAGQYSCIAKGSDCLLYLLCRRSSNGYFVAGPFLSDISSPEDAAGQPEVCDSAIPRLSIQRQSFCLELMATLFDKYSVTEGCDASTESNFFDIVEGSVAARRVNQLPTYDYLSVKQQIRHAMLDKPSQILFDFLQHTFEYNIPGTISKDPLHTRKILSFTFLSAIVKTAIETGVEVFRAFIINDLYLTMIDSAESIAELDRLLFEAILSLSRELKADKPQKYNKYVRFCLSYISNNLSGQIKLKEIAAELKLTPEYLSRTFSREVGKPFGEYLMEFRMIEARRMIIFTKESCSAIAYLTGFSSSSHFSKAFMKYWRISPRKLRVIENTAGK